MRPAKINTVIFIYIVSLIACQTQRNQAPRKPFRLYKMGEFNINSANDFVKQIQYLTPIYEISIVDTRGDGNNFVVNRQQIFLDTTQQEQPNYYSYKKRAVELHVSADSLLNCLKTFYKMGVNDFSRDNNHFRFRVVTGLTTHRGYIYSENNNLQSGDSLPATSVRNKDYHFKVVLVRQMDKHWFEHFEISNYN